MFKLKVIQYWLQMKFRQKFGSRAAIESFQKKKLNSFADEVLSRSSYYQKYFVNEVFQWEKVPVISKTEFMDHFDEMNTVGLKKEMAMKVAIDAEKSREFESTIDGITVGLSTGTSGSRGLFLVSENERALWAALVIERIVKPQLFKKKKVAFFLRANSNLYSSVESSLLEFRYFDIFQPIEKLIVELQAFQPDIIAAQPSILIDLAEAQQQKKIDVSPEQIISFAEVLHEDDKKRIQSQFPCRFTEVYQCTEGMLGISCEHGTIHLNEDFIQFEREVIGERMFYPIITDFTRSTQPVVKYKLNDVLVEKETLCLCGSKLLGIEKILGRDDDVLEFIGKNGIVKIYPDLISRRIALATETHFKYQIRQKDYQTLELFSDIRNEEFEKLNGILKTELEKLLKEQGVSEVSFKFNNHLVHVQGNKNRRIIKEFA